MENCVFCRLVRGDIPAAVVYEDELTIAFMDIGSVNPGHLLVAAKTHAENILDVDEATAGALFKTASRVARAIDRALKPEGISVYQANGEAAGQTVFHIHVHVVPRWIHDGMRFTWPVNNPPREELERVAQQLRSAL